MRHGDARRSLEQTRHYDDAVPMILSSYGRSDSAGEIEVDIKVSGTVCDGCSGRVTDALNVSRTFHCSNGPCAAVAAAVGCCAVAAAACASRRVLLLLVVRLMSRSNCQKWTVTHADWGLCCRRADRWLAVAVACYRACRRCTRWTSTWSLASPQCRQAMRVVILS
jgi:hypothetical protein